MEADIISLVSIEREKRVFCWAAMPPPNKTSIFSSPSGMEPRCLF